jgi:hypothetical protein
MPDIDIHRAARLMIRRYGEDAVIQAAMRGDELLTKGDKEGQHCHRVAIPRANA